jgi:hypothetical protein
MVQSSPATDLARLRVRHGGAWRIDRQDGRHQEAASGPGWSAPPLYVAVHRSTGKALTDTTAGGLASKIQTAETGR